MLKNMRAEIARNDYSYLEMAKVLGITKNTLSAKIRGKSQFKMGELEILKRIFFPDCDIQYLMDVRAEK